jgi:hypothetical protein
MDNKYYIPTIDEFHVGFRYEISYVVTYTDGRENKYTPWKKKVADTMILKMVKNNVYEKWDYTSAAFFRAKYLDRDDIEELGWTYKGKHYYYKQDEWYEIPCDKYSNYYLHKYNDSDIGRGGFTIIQASPDGYSLQGDDIFKFDGDIKNYNEFKFLMSRLSINKANENSK